MMTMIVSLSTLLQTMQLLSWEIWNILVLQNRRELSQNNAETMIDWKIDDHLKSKCKKGPVKESVHEEHLTLKAKYHWGWEVRILTNNIDQGQELAEEISVRPPDSIYIMRPSLST